MVKRTSPSLALICIPVLGFGEIKEAFAETLEEIIVTAQKRPENLRDVPISVSAVSGDKIRKSHIIAAAGISAYVPNFTVTHGPISDKINIRGIQSGNQAGFEQSVATVVDNVYRSRGIQSRWAFLDLEQVEVLRGPQPTLFGINTVAGAINISSARPTPEAEGEASILYNSEFDALELQGVISGPLSNSLAGRVAILSRDMDEGWVLNAHYDEDNPVSEEFFARVSMEWDMNDDTVVYLRHENGDFDVDGRPFVISRGGPISPLLAAAGIPEGQGFETNMGNGGFPLLGIPGEPVLDFGSVSFFSGDTQETVLEIDHLLGGGSHLVGIASYSSYSFDRFVDADFNPLPVARFDDSEDFDQTSLELRLVSETGDRFEYLAGVYYQENDLFVDSNTPFGLTAIDTLLSGNCALVPNAPAAVVPGDAVATAISVAGLPGANAVLTNACAQTALTQVLLPAGVTGATRYTYLDQEAESLAAFSQITWNVNETLRASLGLRYTWHDKSAGQGAYAAEYAIRSNTPLSDQSLANPQALASFLLGEFTTHAFVPSDPGMDRDDDNFTWSFNAQWDVTGEAMIYGSASTGYKAGGFNSFYLGLAQGMGADSRDVQFEEEEVLNFEVGAKLTLLDGAAELNLAAFHTSYDDLQVAIFSGNAAFVVQNAAEATSRGIELDGRWQASDALVLSASLGWLDFEYDNFPNQGCVAEQFLDFREAAFQSALAANDPVSAGLASLIINNQSCASAGLNNMRGRPSAHSPEWTAALIGDYVWQIGGYDLAASVDLHWSDEVYRQDDLDPFSLQESYTTLNSVLSLRPTDGVWEISLIGKNLTDEETFTYVNDMPLFDGARFMGVDMPRSISIRASMNF